MQQPGTTLHTQDYIAAFLSGALGVLDKRTQGSDATPAFQNVAPERATTVDNPDSPTQRQFDAGSPLVIGGIVLLVVIGAAFALKG